MARSKSTGRIDGKQQIHAAQVGPQSVYDIIGKKTFPYSEKTSDEYLKHLESMNFSDLQRHAVEVANLLPNIDKRERLVNKLLEIYLKKQTQFLNVKIPDTMTEAQKASSLEILKRGRS